jgi:hypothetical protein
MLTCGTVLKMPANHLEIMTRAFDDEWDHAGAGLIATVIF